MHLISKDLFSAIRKLIGILHTIKLNYSVRLTHRIIKIRKNKCIPVARSAS